MSGKITENKDFKTKVFLNLWEGSSFDFRRKRIKLTSYFITRFHLSEKELLTEFDKNDHQVKKMEILLDKILIDSFIVSLSQKIDS